MGSQTPQLTGLGLSHSSALTERRCQCPLSPVKTAGRGWQASQALNEGMGAHLSCRDPFLMVSASPFVARGASTLKEQAPPYESEEEDKCKPMSYEGKGGS